MRSIVIAAISFAALMSPGAQGDEAETIVVGRRDARTAVAGPQEYFTGTAWVEPLLDAKGPSRVTAASVTFEPGARSAWHSHPLGQHLIVTEGSGWVQQEGGQRIAIKAGDVIWTPPGVKHWHGATSAERMTHIAIQEVLDGVNVTWMEKVTDEQYRK